MNSLNIQQDLNISELVTTKLIQKLYDTALSVPKPSGKNPDNAYMSGRLEVPKSYRSQVLYLAGNINGEPNASGRFPDLRIDVTNTYYIDFEDPEVLPVLMSKNISSDGVGITESDASNFNSNIDYWFAGNTNITTFNELKYFTSLSIGSAWFLNCSNLTSVDLSKIKLIPPRAFEGCTNLAIEINAPMYNAVSLAWLAFKSSGVTKVLNLGLCTLLDDNVFNGCLRLTEVTLPSTCTVLRNRVFNDCRNLSEINVEYIAQMGAANFAYTDSLDVVMYFKNLLLAYENNFNGFFTGGYKYVYAPKLQAGGGGYDLGGNSVYGMFAMGGWSNTRSPKKIVYFKDISTIQTGCFCGSIVKHLIINRSTPPTVTAFGQLKQDLLIDVSGNGVANSVVQNVWVPDAAVSTYQLHLYWGEFGNKIQGLSGMSKVATKELWDLLSDSAKEDTLIEEYM